MERIGGIVARRPGLAWVLVVGLSIPPFLGFCGYELVDREKARWDSADQRRDLEDVKQAFSNRFSGFPNFLVLESEDFFQRDRLNAIRESVQILRSRYTVAWLGDLQQATLFGDRLPLLPGADASQDELDQERPRLMEHPLVKGQLLSADGGTMLVGFLDWQVSTEDEALTSALRVLRNAGVTVRLTGISALRDSYYVAIGEAHDRTMYTAIVVIMVLALIIFRGLPAIIIASSGPCIGLLWALGWLELLGGTNNDLSEIIVPVLVLVVGFTDAVHFVVDIRQQRVAGRSQADAAAHAVHQVGLACFLTSITTAIGFLSLLLADSEVVDGFGRDAAIGVVITFVSVTLIVPLMSTTRLGRNIHRGVERDLVGKNIVKLTWLIDAIVRHGRAVAIGGVIVTIGLGFGASRLEPDDWLGNRIPHGTEAWEAMEHCDQTFGGIRVMRLGIKFPAGADTEVIWNVIAECEQLIRDEELLGEPLSIRAWLTLAPGANRHQKLRLTRSIPEQFRREFWNGEAQQTQVVARMQDLGIRRYRPVLSRLRSGIESIKRRHAGFQVTLTGDAIVEAEVVQDVVSQLLKSLFLAAGIIFITITIAYRSIRVSLLSLVPNMFPLVATACVRASIDTSLDIASATSFAICLGIAVDDTIHFLTRYQYERRQGSDVQLALHNAFMTVGSALVMTTVVMVSGFASVLTSSLPTHFYFASMACSTIAAALIGDLVLLPALLAWMDGSASGK